MKKLNKKGFTLIELLAVIAILSILIVVAFPGVMSLYNSAKENTFKAQAQSIWRSIEQQIVKNALSSDTITCYSGGVGLTKVPNDSFEMSGQIRYKATVEDDLIKELIVQQMNGSEIVYSTTMVSVDQVTVTDTGTSLTSCP